MHRSNLLRLLPAGAVGRAGLVYWKAPRFLADDDVVVHRDAEPLCDIDDRLRHLDVGARRRRVAGGMIVQDVL